jgi:CheY-like chemotaxis protein
VSAKCFSNLTNNAIKFTEKGQVLIQGREVERKGNVATLEFSVTDTGVGIPQDKLSILFEPFSQVDGSVTRKHGGSGLGLSIVKNLSKLLSGDAGVINLPEKGSQFWFRIQANVVSLDQKDEIKHNHEHLDLSKVAQDPISGNVLVADDEIINRKVIELMLKKMGLTVVLAENGQMALDIVKANQSIDLVLMDLQMPIMDGHTATQEIRKWETSNNLLQLPIVAFTADAFEETSKKSRSLGMDDVLTKPVSITALRNVLKKHLDR